ncbi:phosphotransferase enzyme family protein [Zobellia uliginosa]|uniref:phosphotransferase enzyme family protein n=1 Tax=Zobellia uliginosa TaxID=143224 RepID=UPI0026E2B7C5|nr:aminoglycoside phosphotransferase family protein [Zobellia uliginosa]MDO6517330.1 aminoglycoside phosphotransferase family protein [Zobellia uliginosa]
MAKTIMDSYSHEKLNTLLGHFSVPEKNYLIKPLTDGLINDTFLVFDASTPLYILQRVNHLVFTDVDGLMNNIHHAFRYLHDTDYTKITLVKSNKGNSYHRTETGDYWRVMTYIDGSTAYNTTENPNIAYEAGKIIGKFNSLLQQARLDDYIDTIPRFHDIRLRKVQFESAIASANSEKLKTAEKAINFTHEVLESLMALDLSQLPLRVCHNDTKLNNILFSKATEKALCLIDLDTLMKGYFLFDFGDAIRTIANTAAEDEQDHDKIVFDETLFEAFVDGLGENGAFLTQKEIELLPWGAVLMPFLHGIRALTDFLNNNVYYKVAYENQNLDRGLSLYNFTQKALDRIDYMEKVLEEKLKK